MLREIGGCWTALVTPFKDDYSIDWEGYRQNIEFQVSQGVTGVLPMGTTGESPTVYHDEHAEIIANAVEYSQKKCMILAGTGSNSTPEALDETREAMEAGVDAALLVDCYYNKPSSMALRLEYHGIVAGEFPDLAIVPYVIPGRSVTALVPEDLAILQSEHPNVVAVKEATGDIERMKKTRDLLGSDFSIMSGDDGITHEIMTSPEIKANGVVSVMSNLMPGSVESMTRALLEGDNEKARELNKAMTPLFDIVGVKTIEEVQLPGGKTVEVEYKFPNPLAVKAIMNGLGMNAGVCRQPMGKLTKQGVEIAREAVATVWKNNPALLEPIAGHYSVDINERIEKDRYWSKLSY